MSNNIRTPRGIAADDPLIETLHQGAQTDNDPHRQILGAILYNSDKTPLTAMPIAEQLVTFVATRPIVATATSTQIIAANANRKAGSYLVNNTSSSFYLQYGAAAVVGQGVPFEPGSIFKFNTQQAIFAIQSSGGSLNLDCFEAT